MLLTLGAGTAWGADYSATHTSNVTFTAGTNGSSAKVIINSTEYDAMKLGTSSKTGTMTFTIPVGTTKIHLHVAGWNGKNTTFNITAGNGVTLGTTSITSTADAGVKDNSPFTISSTSNVTSKYYKVIDINSGATTSETTITITTNSTGYRAVVWGVNAETAGGSETPGEGGGEDPDSGEETSATMTAGTNGTACTVNGKDGIKVGTSSKGGDMQITVPAGATMLHVYAAAWKGVTNLSLNITPTSNVTTTSIALQANDGIANSTPFTLSGDEADYLFDIPLQNITAETTLTFTSSTTERFVVWGATCETAGGDEPGSEEPVASLTANPTTIDFGTVEQGATIANKTVAINFANLTGQVNYSGLSNPFTATGTVSNSGDNITIAANTATIGEYSQTLTIASAADSKTAEVTVTMNVVAPFVGKKLVFDFVTHPSGWPAAKANATAGNYVYTLDEVDYTFSHTKSGDGIYLGGTSKTSGYLMLASGNKLGLPAIKGYKLVKVDGTLNGSGSPSTASQVSITNAGGAVISGGAAQTWDTKGGTKTYNLTDTEVNTVYYLTVANKNLQMITLALYYEEVAGAADIPDAPTLTASQEFETETFTVEISAVDGATIHYTLDGSDPTETSTTYSAPFTVNATTTVKAIAVKDGVASNVATATYTKVSVIEKTCAEAAALCTSSTESTDKYRVEGYVTAIETAYSAQYNNITVWMADTRNGGNVLQAFRATPTVDVDKAVKVGDKIEVVGKLKLYNSVPEIVSGTYTITQLDPVYIVNITSEHGTATATPSSAVEGTEITLNVEVESGWVFQSWTVTDAYSNPIEVVENKFTMPASDVKVVANYTKSEAPDAVLTLMANGNQLSQVTYKQGEKAKLPATIANDCVKMFVGWSADANCATAPEYAPGADFTLTAEEHTLYAVYATGVVGENVTITSSAVDNDAENDIHTFTIDATGYSLTAKKNSGSTAPTINASAKDVRIYAKGTLTISASNTMSTIVFNLSTQGKKRLAPITASVGAIATQASGDATVTWTGDATEVTFTVGDKANYGSDGSDKAGQLCFNTISITSEGSFDNYSTTCQGALAAPTFSVAEGTYNTAQSVVITADEGTIYYTLDGTTPTSASTQYTEAIVLDECGTTTIKAIAISSESESPVASAIYTISLPIPANDADNPYTGTEAIEVYNGGCYDGETLVYVTGTVQEVEYSSSYGNYEITFADGFQCYRLQKTADEKFSEDVIGAGDVIVACGKLDKFGSNYQLAAGCYLVKHTPSVKADAELAWNPETVTLIVGDAFTAPTLSNPHSVSGITYESSNEDVATVSAEGVIALVDDAVGTATITAKFGGDDNYKAAEVSCIIKVKAIPEDCEGSDDFETLDVAAQYDLRKTTAGWIAENAAVAEIEGNNYIIINGKTTKVGTITSPVLNGGIGSIKIRYANTYNEDNGVSFKLDIKQNDAVVKTFVVDNDEVTKEQVYTEFIENINVAGDFQMVFTNLHPTNNSTSNKDRVSIGRLCWTGYEEAPQEPTTVTLTYDLTTDAVTNKMGRRYVTAEDATLGNVQIILPSFNTETTEYTDAYLAVGDETISGATATYTADAESNSEIYTAIATSENGTTYNVTMNIIVPVAQEYTFFAMNDAEYVTEDWGEEGDPFIVYMISGEGYLNDEIVAFDMLVDQMGNLEATINDVYVMGTATDLVEEEGTIWLQGSANDEDGNTYSIEIYVAQAVEEVEIVITEEVDVTLDKLTLEVMGNMAMVTAGDEELSFWMTLLETENYYGSYSFDMFDNIWYGDVQLQAYGDGIYNRNGLVVSFISVPDTEGNATKYNFTLKPENYTRTVAAGNYGTICLPFGSTNYTGAEFYEFVGKEEGKAYLASVTTLEAGVPYIFRATASEVAVYSDGTTADEAGSHNGLHGTFTNDTEVAAGNYILSNNAICQCEATCYVNANRAYIVWNEIPAGAPQQMPGRRYIGLDVHGENGTTGLDDIMTTATPVKVIENGQLIIIRDGVKYNVQGQKL